MKEIFMYKLFKIFLIVFLILNQSLVFAAQKYVSISPALTEIIYALNAQDNLIGVSNSCDYPIDAKKKEKIGDAYFINEEKILKLKPDFILALDYSYPVLKKFEKYGITPICLQYPDIDTIYKNIITLGRLTNKEQNAKKIVANIKSKIEKTHSNKQYKILYLLQLEPMITIGQKSFITDVIKKSGQKSVTDNLNSFYPVISEEYAIKSKPDIIILTFPFDTKRLKQLFPTSKIITLTKKENDVINRPSIRIYKAVEYFSNLTISNSPNIK